MGKFKTVFDTDEGMYFYYKLFFARGGDENGFSYKDSVDGYVKKIQLFIKSAEYFNYIESLYLFEQHCMKKDICFILGRSIKTYDNGDLELEYSVNSKELIKYNIKKINHRLSLSNYVKYKDKYDFKEIFDKSTMEMMERLGLLSEYKKYKRQLVLKHIFNADNNS